MATDEYIIALHRYFIWADRMRVHFDNVLRAGVERYESERMYRIETNIYMSYWYAGMYVVIEGYKSLRFADSKIDELLKSSNVKLLKRYRNGAFHFQRKYYDERFLDFIIDDENTVKWIRDLRKEFSRFFLERLSKEG